MAKGSNRSTLAAKGVVIGEKRLQDEVLDISPIKKGISTTDSKGKKAMSLPETKKKRSKSKATLSKATSKEATPTVASREGTSDNPDNVLGLNASMLENPAVAKKLLEGMIPPFDREEVGKLDLNREI